MSSQNWSQRQQLQASATSGLGRGMGGGGDGGGLGGETPGGHYRARVLPWPHLRFQEETVVETLAPVATPARYSGSTWPSLWQRALLAGWTARMVPPWLSPSSPDHFLLLQELFPEARWTLRARPGPPDPSRWQAEGAAGLGASPRSRAGLPHRAGIHPLLELSRDSQVTLWAECGSPGASTIQSLS